MELYLQVENGQPVNHPAFGDNLRQAFGEIPDNWEPFERLEKPIPGMYEVISDDPVYQKVDGVWKDTWVTRDMTAEEKAAKQQAVKDVWAAREQAENWSAWVFNEATCTYEPPIPRPEGLNFAWCGAENNWKERPEYPTDGKQYKFDFLAWQWISV